VQHHALAWQLLTAEDSHAGDLHMPQIDRYRAWCDEGVPRHVRRHPQRGSTVRRLRTGRDDNGLRRQRALNAFLATVPVELPSVGAVQALSLFVAGADPQDGPGEPSIAAHGRRLGRIIAPQRESL
jgi:hypothetical protein